MNRIEEMHRKQLFVIDSPSTDKEGDKSHAAKLATEITVDISCRFAEWIANNNWLCSSNELWYHKSDGIPDEGITTAELFNSEEFQKTI